MKNTKLRVIGPYNSRDIYAWVYKKSIRSPGVVIIEGHAEDGQPSEIVMSSKEARDMMLWLKCTLDET